MWASLRVALGMSLWLSAGIGAAQAQGPLCGKSPAVNTRIGNIAVTAHHLCAGVNEIADSDLGLLTMSDGIDPREPACGADMARDLLAIKAEHDSDPAWCTRARAVLRYHPLTQGLVAAVEPEPPCSEIDKVAALVSAAVTRCRFTTTRSGRAVLLVKFKAVCRQRWLDTYALEVTDLEAELQSRDKAQSQWCAEMLDSHTRQMQAAGFANWFE